MGKYLHEAKHDSADDEGRDGCADKGQGQDGPDVSEKEPLLHAVAGVEDDRWEDDVEENFWIKSCFLINLKIHFNGMLKHKRHGKIDTNSIESLFKVN